MSTAIEQAEAGAVRQSLPPVVYRLSPQHLTRVLTLIVLLLICAGAVGQSARAMFGDEVLHQYHVRGVVEKFDLDGEVSIPNYYSAFSLLLCALLIWLIAHARRAVNDPYRRHWQWLAVIFLGLSLDEGAELHDLTVDPLRTFLQTDNFLYFAWVIPAAFFLIFLALAYLRFLRDLPPRTRLRFLLAALIFITGAAGTEMIGGWLRQTWGLESLQYVAGTIAEESLEMLGILVFLRALLIYLSEQVREVGLHFVGQ